MVVVVRVVSGGVERETGRGVTILLSRQIVFSMQQGVAPLLHQKLLEVSHGLRVLLSVSVAMWQEGWPSLSH